VQCVLADINDYAALNDRWRREFDDVAHAPSRFTYQAGALPFGAKIEIQAVAARAGMLRGRPGGLRASQRPLPPARSRCAMARAMNCCYL
jgi:hypothetical protein